MGRTNKKSNIHKNARTSGNTGIKNSIVQETNLSEELLIEIHAEAYYKALNRIKQEETESKATPPEKEKYKWYIEILFMLNVVLFPWKINGKFKINDKLYDGILVLVVSLVLQLFGVIAWSGGMLSTIICIIEKVHGAAWKDFATSIAVSIMITLLGSMFLLSGKEFSKVSDSNIIYAYSASIIALISCVVGIIALVSI